MSPWSILIIILLVIVVVWWALLRNAGKYKPDFPMHHDESHAEHGDEGEAATAHGVPGHEEAAHAAEQSMQDPTFRAHAAQVEAAAEQGMIEQEVQHAYTPPTPAEAVTDDASHQEAIQNIAAGQAEPLAPPAPPAIEGQPAGPRGEAPHAASPEVAPDDLIIIEGIGPRVNQLLQGAGIITFRQLAETSPEALRQILAPAGLRMLDPETWPEQARLAADGQMEALQQLQQNLKGGRIQ
ncbi:MAG: hypothetical protein ACKOC5_07530 [Chloroflexota bacterium]